MLSWQDRELKERDSNHERTTPKRSQYKKAYNIEDHVSSQSDGSDVKANTVGEDGSCTEADVNMLESMSDAEEA